MRLAIVGTREPSISYDEWKEIILSKWWFKHADTIVSGGARGIDSYGKKLATECKLKYKDTRRTEKARRSSETRKSLPMPISWLPFH